MMESTLYRRPPTGREDMTTKDKVARRKLSLPQFATEMDNVSKACRIMGDSRQQFHEIRRNYQTDGADGLIDRLPGAKGPHPNRVSTEIEAAKKGCFIDQTLSVANDVSHRLKVGDDWVEI